MGINFLSRPLKLSLWTAPFRLPIHALAMWLGRDRLDSPHGLPMAVPRAPIAALPKPTVDRGRATFAVTASACASAAVRPGRGHNRLKVLREPDSSRRGCAGRMVISGRMADVCAELDRMAQSENQLRVTHNAHRAGA